MAKEPVFRDTETRVFVEGLDKQLSVPERNSTVWKRGGAYPSRELALNAAEFVLEILSPAIAF